MSLTAIKNCHSVTTLVQTAEDILNGNIAFEIPPYQRPYVWGAEGVLKLLQDIEQAYVEKEHQYYIGTVLSAKLNVKANQGAQTSFELIDGQQRMTTLMLIAIAFKNADVECELTKVATLYHLPRVTFSIRETVQGLLCSWSNLEFTHKPSDEEIHKNEYTKHLAEALKTASSFIEKIRSDGNKSDSYLIGFGDFFFKKVRWVNNIIPTATDLNKLFATMNTSGVQLEHSDILKSKLLSKLNRNLKEYDCLWQVCENLNNYFERNARKVFTASDWTNIQDEDLSTFNLSILKLVNTKTVKVSGLTLTEIVRDQTLLDRVKLGSQHNSKAQSTSNSDEDVYCRSIISFPLLLIHAFRIYCALEGNKVDIKSRVNGERLNNAFEKFIQTAKEDDVLGFLHCLWKVRYQFDKWVVKWVEKAEESTAVLRMSTVNYSKTQNRLNRVPSEITALSQLQSVRYFTGERSAQHWLTAFLGCMVRTNTSDKNVALLKLEDIDNKMSLGLFVPDLSQKEASFEYITNTRSDFGYSSDITDYLKLINGTGFEHYWFQKLEYVLWKNELETNNDKFRKYRISSKNSVEHVYPQHEEYNNKLESNFLNAFGNLVLLSPGENSSYSNQTVSKKQADFNDKPVYDSLKLKHIFELKQHEEWDKDKIKQHQKAMIDLLQSHYSSSN
ncbi:DUF262 domain-containing protein [Vibrio parahaemolyticus]|uniref:DUF262 domain-containing protein n=1 Tax=Vibrio parahaemolyticus TaxID=670 RepID=UPI00128EF16D|nr:DUF262 domain-containing protein [Vibrio parahaemolyticus]MQC31160.1 DUF262 domain-containing protein [Vibrio parahaemolyticus]